MISIESFALQFVEMFGPGVAYVEQIRNGAIIARAVRDGLGIADVGTILGHGSYAMVASIGRGQVLKLTTDPNDVLAASMVAAHPLPHSVHIDGAWFIRGARVGNSRVGAILAEKLDKLPNAESLQWLNDLVSEIKIKHHAASWALIEMSPERSREVLRRASYELANRLQYADDPVFWQIAEGIEELRDLGIYTVDVHLGNVGYDRHEDRYKIFDFGLSRPPAIRAPVLRPGLYGVVPVAAEEFWL